MNNISSNVTNISLLNQSYHILNNSKIVHSKLKPLQKLAYYFLILLILIFISFFTMILVLLIRKKIRKIMEKMRRIKLQQEINRIMMLDIVETPSSSENSNSGFYSISNDSSVGDIQSTNSSNILSEINVHNEVRNSKGSNDS